MGSLRAKLVDKNRFAKRYPLIRAPVRNAYLADGDLAIEIGTIDFSNATSGTLTFDKAFPDASVQIMAIARSDGTNPADVNVFITEKSKTAVTVETSANFTGYVDIFAVRVG